VERLEKLILAHHPYETAEVIALPLRQGTPAYLRWIDESVSED
jgi:periplasmic divalent cation tolerance protein